MKNTKVVIFGDLHCPFHDEEALDLVLNYVRKNKPEAVVLNGDILDCYKISRFNKDPNARSFYDEIVEGRKILKKIENAVPQNARLIWLDGNHEERIQKYTRTNAPEFEGLISVPSLMRFDDIDVEYHTHSQPLFINNIVIKHGSMISSIASGYSVKKELDKETESVIMGHTHRLAIIHKTYRNRTVFGVEGGHLSDISQIDYMYGKVADWQQGFTELIEINNELYPRIYRIVNGEVV